MEIKEKYKLKECKLCGTTKADLFYWVNTDMQEFNGKWFCICNKCNMESQK